MGDHAVRQWLVANDQSGRLCVTPGAGVIQATLNGQLVLKGHSFSHAAGPGFERLQLHVPLKKSDFVDFRVEPAFRLASKSFFSTASRLQPTAQLVVCGLFQRPVRRSGQIPQCGIREGADAVIHHPGDCHGAFRATLELKIRPVFRNGRSFHPAGERGAGANLPGNPQLHGRRRRRESVGSSHHRRRRPPLRHLLQRRNRMARRPRRRGLQGVARRLGLAGIPHLLLHSVQ